MFRNSVIFPSIVAASLLVPMAAFSQQSTTPAHGAKPNSGMQMTKAPAASGPVTRVNGGLVCMVTNKAFDKPQLPVRVKGRTYYGCCSMCKHMLQTDAANRYATDPVSGKRVDKSTAVIGRDAKNSVVYFQNEADLQKYNERARKSASGKDSASGSGPAS